MEVFSCFIIGHLHSSELSGGNTVFSGSKTRLTLHSNYTITNINVFLVEQYKQGPVSCINSSFVGLKHLIVDTLRI